MNITFNSRELVLDAADANDAKQAREFVDLYLRRLGTPESDFYSASLAFGELIANVVRHAPGRIEVRVDWSGPAPLLSVRDHGPGFVPDLTLPEDPLAEGGRGLYIIASIVQELRVEKLDGNGMLVSVVLPVARAV